MLLLGGELMVKLPAAGLLNTRTTCLWSCNQQPGGLLTEACCRVWLAAECPVHLLSQRAKCAAQQATRATWDSDKCGLDCLLQGF